MCKLVGTKHGQSTKSIACDGVQAAPCGLPALSLSFELVQSTGPPAAPAIQGLKKGGKLALLHVLPFNCIDGVLHLLGTDHGSAARPQHILIQGTFQLPVLKADPSMGWLCVPQVL